MLNQPAFDWKVPDRYVELLNFEKEVVNVLHAKVYDLNDEKVHIIKNWLGWEGLQFTQTVTNAEKDTCKMQQDCFNVLKEKFKATFM